MASGRYRYWRTARAAGRSASRDCLTGVPATLKVKFVPTATPAPATLQTCRKPLVGIDRYGCIDECHDGLPARQSPLQ